MNYKTMLLKLDWDFKYGANSIGKLERILASFKKSLSHITQEAELKDAFREFWADVAENNVYMCAILVKKQEKFYGTNDLCIIAGFEILEEYIQTFSLDFSHKNHWYLFAALELHKEKFVIEYTRLFLSKGHLKEYLRFLQYSSNISSSVLFFLHTIFISDTPLRREVLQKFITLKWNIEIGEESKSLISEILDSAAFWGDIPSLINLIDLCTDLKFSVHSNMSIQEWKNILLEQYQPISMILYRKILKREGLMQEEILDDLFSFTSWSNKKPEHKINNYLFFAYAIRCFPEKFDNYNSFFDESSSFSDVTDMLQLENANKLVKESSLRGLNNVIVEKPFLELIKHNPEKVPEFIKRTEPFSLYRFSNFTEYRKSQTWMENNYLNDYRNYITDYAKNHSAEETITLYFSSPLKSIVDFSYVLRMLFQPKENFVDLVEIMKTFTLRGKLLVNKSSSPKTAYRVSLSNGSSSYIFPLHHSWVLSNLDMLQNDFEDGETVYFNIMSINSQGMIFAHNLTKYQQTSKNEPVKKDKISFAIKNYEQIKANTFALQGNNIIESIKIFAIALIYDEDSRIIVESLETEDGIKEFLPFLPVANRESSDRTIKRLLKYFLGINNDIEIQACGLIHFFVNRETRNLFIVYKIPVSQYKNNIITKSSIHWQKIDTYFENAQDSITKSFADFLQNDWTEKAFDM